MLAYKRLREFVEMVVKRGSNCVGRRWRQNGSITYMFDESTLVLESVTFAKVVKFVVKVLVDLA